MRRVVRMHMHIVSTLWEPSAVSVMKDSLEMDTTAQVCGVLGGIRCMVTMEVRTVRLSPITLARNAQKYLYPNTIYVFSHELVLFTGNLFVTVYIMYIAIYTFELCTCSRNVCT